jgi:hypothetical protein
MRIPDFFIVGAPKCGTTALWTYLSTHPDLFLPELKEPHYFSSDFPEYGQIKTIEEYAQLFAGTPAHVLLGEASVWYLYSEVAVPKIIVLNPEAKMIAILRNPVEMVYSLHYLLVHTLDEDIEDFEVAWESQHERAHGRRIPKHCREPKHLLYKNVCSFSGQVERLLRAVPLQQRLVLLYEDLAADPRATYRRVLEFLGVPDDGRTSFPRVNASATRRSAWLNMVLRTLPKRIAPIYRPAKSLVNSFGLRPGVRLTSWNVKEKARSPLDPALRRRLVREFAPDIDRLEQLLGRSLDRWRNA